MKPHVSRIVNINKALSLLRPAEASKRFPWRKILSNRNGTIPITVGAYDSRNRFLLLKYVGNQANIVANLII